MTSVAVLAASCELLGDCAALEIANKTVPCGACAGLRPQRCLGDRPQGSTARIAQPCPAPPTAVQFGFGLLPMLSQLKRRFQTVRSKRDLSASAPSKSDSHSHTRSQDDDDDDYSMSKFVKQGSGMELHPDEHNACEYRGQGLTVFVIGASGDLAKKKTYPSLFALYVSGYLPEHATIVGYARSAKTDDEFRQHLDSFLKVRKDDTAMLEKKQAFLSKCLYRHGKYDSADDVGKVSHEMELLEDEKNQTLNNRLFYFAIPPSVFVPIGTSIKKAALTTRGWNRLIVEKPFGHDLASFDELSRDMGALYSEDEIYRIDHYLGKEMVQNLLVLRFANAIFEPMWNRNYISSVVITFKEDIGTQGRGGYFDSYGIIRDVMQNHLLQVLSLVAMEPPVLASGNNYSNYIRDEKVKVLNCIQPISLDETVIGQYEGNPEVNEPGYLEDPTVPKGSVTPTFATCVLRVNNARWDGVPFIMKAGKALNERKGEIRVQFRPPPGASHMFPDVEIPIQELVMRLQPEEAVYMKVNVKSPGLATSAISSELDLSYAQRYAGTEVPDAYTRLILDVLRGKQAAFVRDDELRAAWKIFTPLLDEIEGKKIKPLPYKFGSRGPKESDELTRSVGFQYHRGRYQWKAPKAQSSHL